MSLPVLLNLMDVPVSTQRALVWHAELHCLGQIPRGGSTSTFMLKFSFNTAGEMMNANQKLCGKKPVSQNWG